MKISTFSRNMSTFLGKMNEKVEKNVDHNIVVYVFFFNVDDVNVQTSGNFSNANANVHS